MSASRGRRLGRVQPCSVATALGGRPKLFWQIGVAPMSSPDWSRSLLGAAETLAAICSGAYDPTHPEEGEELALWLRRRLDAWKPSWDGRRTALDEAARAYVVAAIALWDAHGARGPDLPLEDDAVTPSLLCAWLRSLGWRRMPAPLSSWDCYTLGVDVVEVPMLGEARDWPRWARECVQEAAEAMGWSAERAWADYHLGPWRADGPEMLR